MWFFSWFKHDPSKDEIAKANKESLKLAEQEEEEMRRLEKSKKKGKTKQVDDGDHVEDKGQVKPSKDHVEKEDLNPLPSICYGCNSAIEDGIHVDAFDVLWHPLCLICLHCQQPIAKKEISNSKGQYHRPCYHKCYVCEKKIEKGIKYNSHPFWKEKYCPGHDDDGTAKCCSCERLEQSFGTKYVNLEDGRWLCRECMECAVMDTAECQNLHSEILEFFEGLNMKIKKKVPLLLVEKEALNKAEKEEKIDNHYGMVTRGICLSEEQMVTSVTKWSRIGPNKQIIVDTQKVVREYEVTAILILYGLPRFLTGYILAHEMMHAWLRLNGYRNLNTVLEEGLCQVLGHMWLEPQTYATLDVVAAAETADASSSSSPSRTPPATTTSKKCDPSVFEKKLVEFCKHQIETDDSAIYGLGFKKVSRMMKSNNYSLKDTLKDIVSASKTIPDSKF